MNSCGSGEHKHEGGNDGNVEITVEHEELTLNNGEKWKCNEEMMPYIQGSQKIIVDFRKDHLGSYPALARKLQENIKMLISSCSMTGVSHEELHKWLVPYMDLVQLMLKAETNEEAEIYLKQIETSMSQFNQYFE